LTARSTRTKTDTELVLGHFADRAHTTVAQVIDIIHLVLAVTNVDQRTSAHQQCLHATARHRPNRFTIQTAVELHATHG
jgi:hypothetical protein